LGVKMGKKVTSTRRFHEMIYRELENIVGPRDITDKKVDKIVYSVDYFWIPEMLIDRGCNPPMADYIVHPETSEEVSRIIQLANTYKIPLTVWGGGSGSQGGALPVDGGIIVDIKKLDRVLEIDEKSLIVTAQSGIIAQDLEWKLNERGYTMGHLPASMYCATMAGFLAHRGSGVLSTKYGKIEDMIIKMEVVLPTGEIIRTAPVPRHAAGPDLSQLFIGSEGTLGIITEATFKIHPIPEERRFRAFVFENLHSAYEAGRKIMTRRLRPCTIRLYDEVETRRYVKRVIGVEKEGAYMVFGFDGDKEMVDLEEKAAIKICQDEGGEDLGKKGGEHWWEHKYDFFFPPYMFWIPQMYGTMDTVATYDKMEKIFKELKKVIEKTYPQAYIIAHFSHWYEWGCMGYIRFIIDDPPQDPQEARKLHDAIWDTGINTILANGGMVNEHHGIGIKLARFMKKQYGPAFTVMEKIKRALDPNDIMNPKKLGFGS